MNEFQHKCIEAFKKTLQDIVLDIPDFYKVAGETQDYFVAKFSRNSDYFEIYVYEDEAGFFFNKDWLICERAAYDTDEELIKAICARLEKIIVKLFEVTFTNEKGEFVTEQFEAVSEGDLKKKLVAKKFRIVNIKRLPRVDLKSANVQIVIGVCFTILSLFSTSLIFQVSLPLAKLTPPFLMVVGLLFLFLGISNRRRLIKFYQ